MMVCGRKCQVPEVHPFIQPMSQYLPSAVSSKLLRFLGGIQTKNLGGMSITFINFVFTQKQT